LELYNKKDRKIIEKYQEYISENGILKKESYVEGVYKLPVKNIIDYEKTLTVDEAIAQSKINIPKPKKKKINIIKKKKQLDDIIDIDESDDNDESFNNQILNWKK
jgi:hypothetical protein